MNKKQPRGKKGTIVNKSESKNQNRNMNATVSGSLDSMVSILANGLIGFWKIISKDEAAIVIEIINFSDLTLKYLGSVYENEKVIPQDQPSHTPKDTIFPFQFDYRSYKAQAKWFSGKGIMRGCLLFEVVNCKSWEAIIEDVDNIKHEKVQLLKYNLDPKNGWSEGYLQIYWDIVNEVENFGVFFNKHNGPKVNIEDSNAENQLNKMSNEFTNKTLSDGESRTYGGSKEFPWKSWKVNDGKVSLCKFRCLPSNTSVYGWNYRIEIVDEDFQG